MLICPCVKVMYPQGTFSLFLPVSFKFLSFFLWQPKFIKLLPVIPQFTEKFEWQLNFLTIFVSHAHGLRRTETHEGEAILSNIFCLLSD